MDHCPYHARVRLDLRNGLRAGPGCPPRFVVARPMVALPPVYESWARTQHLQLAPDSTSPLCPEPGELLAPSVAIREPHDRARYLWDPETPAAEASGIRLSARVTPAGEQVVWLVDGRPVAQVAYPHEYRLNLAPGAHTIIAAMAGSDVRSKAVTVTVDN